MALVKCPDCQTEVSDAAAACPKCARPIKPTAAPSAPPPRKAGFFNLQRNLIGVLVLVGIVYGGWYVLPEDKKEALRAIGNVTGADKILLSWEARAQERVKLTSGPGLGEQVVSITHPSATFVRMEPVQTTENGGVVTVTYTVTYAGWTGLASDYRTTVQWRFDKTHSIGVEITEDTAPTPVLTGSVLNTGFADLYTRMSAELAK